jgi:hypothetical protein
MSVLRVTESTGAVDVPEGWLMGTKGRQDGLTGFYRVPAPRCDRGKNLSKTLSSAIALRRDTGRSTHWQIPALIAISVVFPQASDVRLQFTYTSFGRLEQIWCRT